MIGSSSSRLLDMTMLKSKDSLHVLFDRLFLDKAQIRYLLMAHLLHLAYVPFGQSVSFPTRQTTRNIT